MEELNRSDDTLARLARALLGLLAIALAGLLVILSQTPLGAVWARLLDAAFGVTSTHMWWYITRASGIIAYLLLWLSTVWGLAVSSKMFDRLIPRAFTYDAHEYLSLLAIVFTVVHVVVLMFDSFTPFTLAQLFVPFTSSYRPFWVGVGIIGTYLTVLVTVTFYIRKGIGQRAFRVIHYLSFAAYLAVTVHSWFAGTDTTLTAAQVMYGATFLVVVFLTVYWVVMLTAKPNQDIRKQTSLIRS